MTFIACFGIKNLKYASQIKETLQPAPSLTQPGPRDPASLLSPPTWSKYGSSLAAEPGRKTHSAKSQAERREDHKPQVTFPSCFLGTFHVPQRHPPPEVPLQAMGWVVFALSVAEANVGSANGGLGSVALPARLTSAGQTIDGNMAPKFIPGVSGAIGIRITAGVQLHPTVPWMRPSPHTLLLSTLLSVPTF